MLLLSLALLVGAFLLYTQVPALLLYATYPWPVYVLFLASVAAAVVSRRRGVLRVVTIGVSGLFTVLFVVFTLVLTHLNHGQLAVHPGNPFPEFRLQTSTKEWFSPAQLKGQSAALYVFYRGDW